MSRRERTGYYDRTGKAICDGDRIKAIIGGQIYTGYVEEFNDDYILAADSYRRFSPFIADLDDIEILEEGD